MISVNGYFVKPAEACSRKLLRLADVFISGAAKAKAGRKKRIFVTNLFVFEKAKM